MGGCRRLPVAFAMLLGACGAPSTEKPAADSAIAFERASDQVEHGERLSLILGCMGCHGKDLAGQDWSDELGVLWTSNLTRSAAAADDAQLTALITTGERPDRELWGMPSHLFTQLDKDDLAAVIAYVRSKPVTGEIHPEPTFSKALLAEIETGNLASSRADVEKQSEAWPPDAGSQHALGRYIVRATCAECHAMDLRGGKPLLGAAPRPDLRIAASYDRADFVRLLREGVAAGDRKLGLMGEVARGRYSRLTDGEVAAVHGYLTKVAEIDP